MQTRFPTTVARCSPAPRSARTSAGAARPSRSRARPSRCPSTVARHRPLRLPRPRLDLRARPGGRAQDPRGRAGVVGVLPAARLPARPARRRRHPRSLVVDRSARPTPTCVADVGATGRDGASTSTDDPLVRAGRTRSGSPSRWPRARGLDPDTPATSPAPSSSTDRRSTERSRMSDRRPSDSPPARRRRTAPRSPPPSLLGLTGCVRRHATAADHARPEAKVHHHLVDRPDRRGRDDRSRSWPTEFEERPPERHDRRLARAPPSTDDLLQKLSAGFAGDTYPDISYAFGSWASQLEASGRTLDITDQVADAGGRVGRVPRGGRAQTAQPTGDKTIGFPAVVDNLSLIYNTDAVRRGRRRLPDRRLDLGRLPRRRPRQLTDPATEHLRLRATRSPAREETTWQFWPHLWQNGGEILDDDQQDGDFNSDAGVEALTLPARTWRSTTRASTSTRPTRSSRQLFASDRIGMITRARGCSTTSRRRRPPYGVATLPGHRRRPPDRLRPRPLGAVRPRRRATGPTGRTSSPTG